MTIEHKISKIADWISNESQDRYEEVEWLLYSVYQPKKSGLTRDIDDDYESVLNYKREVIMKVIELIECLNGIENKELQVDIKLDEVCEGEEEQAFLDIYSEYMLDASSVLRYEVSSVSEDRAKQLICNEFYIEDREIDKSNAKVISKKEYKVVITNKTKVKNYE